MKYHFIGITFIGSGLILLLIFSFVLFPLSDQGSWTYIIFPIFFLIFLLGVLDIICGLLNLIKQKAYERISIIFGLFSLIVGFLYIMWLYIFWWLALLLFISGTFLLYLGKAKSWK